MNQPYNRISENVLFTALVAVAIGGMALSTASYKHAAPAPTTSVVAAAAVNHS
jgi:hypothetical protein